jgi:hypothetical protein
MPHSMAFKAIARIATTLRTRLALSRIEPITPDPTCGT